MKLEANISILLKAASQYDRDVSGLLIRAGGIEHVRRYHLLFLITLMSLNVFVFIHQLKGFPDAVGGFFLSFLIYVLYVKNYRS